MMPSTVKKRSIVTYGMSWSLLVHRSNAASLKLVGKSAIFNAQLNKLTIGKFLRSHATFRVYSIFSKTIKFNFQWTDGSHDMHAPRYAAGKVHTAGIYMILVRQKITSKVIVTLLSDFLSPQ